MALDPFAAPVCGAFAPLPDKGRLGYLEHGVDAGTVGVSQPARNMGSLVVALLVGVLVGGSLYGWLDSRRGALPDWEKRVVAYQTLYVPETVAAITPEAGELDRQFAVATAAIALDLQPTALASVAPLDLKRVHILGFQDAPLVQMTFGLPDGTPIALYIYRPAGGAVSMDLRVSEMFGLHSARWATESHAFLVIGGADPEPIEDLGKQIFLLYSASGARH